MDSKLNKNIKISSNRSFGIVFSLYLEFPIMCPVV